MKKNTIGLLAFAVLVINTIVEILGIFDIGPSILPLVSYVLLLIVVLWAAWEYAKRAGKNIKFIYIIIFILVIVGLVFGRFRIL